MRQHLCGRFHHLSRQTQTVRVLGTTPTKSAVIRHRLCHLHHQTYLNNSNSKQDISPKTNWASRLTGQKNIKVSFLFLIFRMVVVLLSNIRSSQAFALLWSLFLPLTINKVSKVGPCYFIRLFERLLNYEEFYRLFLIWLFYANKGYLT